VIETSLISRHTQWLKVLGLAAAGALSFTGSAYLSQGTSDNDMDVVMPVVRLQAQSSTSSIEPNRDAPAPGNLPTPYATLQANGSATLAAVTRNPFGVLNLQADMERIPRPLIPVVSSALKPKAVSSNAVSSSENALLNAAALAPTPPPLPFTVVGGISGKQIAGGRPLAFLQQSNDVIVVQAGDQLGSTYRVESITVDRIEFIYLPLQQKQTLPIRQ
jgi:hypothetical protein